jgi:hypothetical protein
MAGRPSYLAGFSFVHMFVEVQEVSLVAAVCWKLALLLECSGTA